MLEKMRRKDRAMDFAATQELLRGAEYGTLATTDSDNRPYLVPMSFVYIEDGIYFHCAPEGRKIENIKTNDKACFNVVAQVELLPAAFSTKYKSAIVSGEIFEVEDENEKIRALQLFVEKYSTDFYASGLAYIEKAIAQTKVFKLSIAEISGKARL
jgi:uncharacterized protein